ncbi:hypothetical protein GCM10028803_37590 [Larkinella knui]
MKGYQQLKPSLNHATILTIPTIKPIQPATHFIVNHFVQNYWFFPSGNIPLQSVWYQKINELQDMLIINVKENESIDKALKRFKKKFEKTGVLRALRSRTAFQKPSIKRRQEILKAVYREKMYGSNSEV